MEYYSIGELCSITKGSTGIMKAVPGPYPLVTTGPDRKSSSDYEFDDEAVCIPLVSSTGHGHKSLNYIHYQSGKFALGTILAAVIPKDKSILSAEYLQRYLFFFKDQLVVSLMKGAANVSLAIRDIAKIQVPVPPISKQKEFIELFNKAEIGKLSLLHENQNQSSYLTKLRQAILQEAIEGKLTADWRKENPARKGDPDYDAEALLEKIQAEKEKLIKEGKIKKQKPLTPIKTEEVPFELPEGWVWTRLGEVSEIIGGYAFKSTEYKKTGIRVVRISDFNENGFTTHKIVRHPLINGLNSFLLQINDIIMAMTGGTVGKTLLIENMPEQLVLNQRVASIRTYTNYLKPFYINFVAKAPLTQNNITELKNSTNDNISMKDITSFLIPLPATAEQNMIIDKVNMLLQRIIELEKQVSERKEQSEQLMQAVLREAFEGGK